MEPFDDMSQTGLPPRLLDLAATLKEVIPPVRWYLHVLVREEYHTEILGTFKSTELAHEAYNKFTKLVGAKTVSCMADYCTSGFAVPWLHVYAAPHEDARKMNASIFNEHFRKKNIAPTAPVPTRPLPKFKETILRQLEVKLPPTKY